MNVTVFGASGKVGKLVVSKLLNDNHQVRAFVYQETNFAEHPTLDVVIGDIHDQSAVQSALEGSDAVISTLGSWHTKTKDILVSGMLSIIPAMESSTAKRIVSLTGSGVFLHEEKRSVFDKIGRTAARLMAQKVFDDGEHHLELLRLSKLDWTVIRSPVMKEMNGNNGFMLTSNPPAQWATIARDDVATALVQQLHDNTWIKSAPFIVRSSNF